jgi:multidrug efflux system outer membrane protein
MPAHYEIAADGVDPSAIGPIPSGPWWTAFEDPALVALIARAHAGNTGIAQARANLALASAAAKGVAALRGPVATIDASATHAQGLLINAAGESGDLFTARLAISWEADLFGRLSGERAAQRQDVLAADALLQGTRLLIEAETARTWFIGRHFAEAADKAHQITALLEEAQGISAARDHLGLEGVTAGEMFRRRLDAARLRESELVLKRDSAWRQLGFLVGEPQAFVSGNLGINPPPPLVPVGLPADLLHRRPDIIASRASLIAADERLRGERNSWLPAIGLTASGGAASASLTQILSAAASSFGFGLLLAVPVFDGGRHKARIAGRQALRDGAAAAYRETVLLALRDVNDSLQALQLQRTAFDKASAAEREGAALLAQSNHRQANGTQSRLDGIEIEVGAIERQISRSEANGHALVASLNLLHALGGGWEQGN